MPPGRSFLPRKEICISLHLSYNAHQLPETVLFTNKWFCRKLAYFTQKVLKFGFPTHWGWSRKGVLRTFCSETTQPERHLGRKEATEANTWRQ